MGAAASSVTDDLMRSHRTSGQLTYMKNLQEMIKYINLHFHRKECENFVRKRHQRHQPQGPNAVNKNEELRCRCGEVRRKHNFMQPVTSAHPGPEWKPTDIKRKDGDCTFGMINFDLGERIPAPYIRMTDDDSLDDLIDLMTTFWGIMKPEKPNLVISVVGGAKNFKLNRRMRDTFATGLIKAAKTTSAWLISSGFNMGVMKAVGQAVRQGQSIYWDNDNPAYKLKCIGIAPYGCVLGRNVLEAHDGKGKFNANYRTSNDVQHRASVSLNPDHTHFIFVDDGYRNRYFRGVAGIRAKLEKKISNSENGLGIPVVLVVVEGGADAISDAKTSLEHNIPVVVCAGTGRAADIIAYAFTKTSGGSIVIQLKHDLKLKKKIVDAYGEKWTEDQADNKTSEICVKLEFCCQNSDMLTVFHMNKDEDLDLAILSVLLKAKRGADEKQRIRQLNLALVWDRVDIAQEEIFREDFLWSTETLNKTMTRALVTNKVKFVDLILQQGSLVMREYLTRTQLEKLYEEIPTGSYLNRLMHKLIGEDKLNSKNINALCKRLLDRFDDDQVKEMNFQRPYKMLLVWAVLLCRVDMAKLFLELGEEPVTSAVAASRIVHAMAKHMPHLESNIRDKLLDAEKEFERFATCVVNECHHSDPDKAMKIVERKSPCWNDMTCLQIAAAATDHVFLSTRTCQQSIDVTWKRGLRSSWYKVLLAMIFPPYILWGIEILIPAQDMLSVSQKCYQKIKLFYSYPLSKFLYRAIMYAVFLILHSYLVLVDFRESQVTAIEIIVVLWVLTFFVDAAHTIIAFPTPTLRAKIRDWFDFFNGLDLINYALAFAGFISHVFGHYAATKIMYCICSVLFFLGIMQIYVAHGQLGPKIFMIRKMFNELRLFMMMLFVFLLAYGVASQGLLYAERSPNWAILKDVIYFPYWQLYGEIELDAITTDDSCDAGSGDCRTFHSLVPVLLMFYMLVGNVLLLNLLIAIFSHVFHKVEENSNMIWKYQRYFLAMEFECKTQLVPPFSIIQHIFLIIRWIWQRICCAKPKNKQVSAKHQLDYLQLFEKEMMMNFLREEKAEEMSGINMTLNKLQKRVDGLTTLIEDENMAYQEPSQGVNDKIVQDNEEEDRKEKKKNLKEKKKKQEIEEQAHCSYSTTRV